jgi:hypothetical protein
MSSSGRSKRTAPIEAPRSSKRQAGEARAFPFYDDSFVDALRDGEAVKWRSGSVIPVTVEGGARAVLSTSVATMYQPEIKLEGGGTRVYLDFANEALLPRLRGVSARLSDWVQETLTKNQLSAGETRPLFKSGDTADKMSIGTTVPDAVLRDCLERAGEAELPRRCLVRAHFELRNVYVQEGVAGVSSRVARLDYVGPCPAPRDDGEPPVAFDAAETDPRFDA